MLRVLVGALGAVIASSALAEEGGSGHYFPGSMASFMDGVSPVPLVLGRVNVIDWDAQVFDDRVIPIAGRPVVNADVDLTAVGLTGFWHPSWGKINEKWSYAMSGTVSFIDLTVEGDVRLDTSRIGSVTERVSDTESGLGDLLLQPLMLNYHHSPDFNLNMRMSVYVPSGDYEVGRLANPGKNYWSIEPTVGAMYFNQKTGWELSGLLGLTINDENSDTNYKSGDQLHFDGTVARHKPAWGGSFGAGLTGYAYRQLEGDSGEGANFGDFKSRAFGVGPIASYMRQVNGHELLVEFKWLHEFAVKNRPEGDILFLKVAYYFSSPG